MSVLLVALLALALYGVQALAGWAVWRLTAVAAEPWPRQLGAALLVGPGVVTLQMIVYHGSGVPFTLPALVTPWLVLAGVVGWLRRRYVGAGDAAVARWLVAVVAVLTVLTAVRALAVPIHNGDEVNNFTLFARVFATYGSLAPERLVSLAEPGHVEYPHLVALNQSWLFLLDGERGPWLARGFDVCALAAFGCLALGAVPRPGGLTAGLALALVALPEVHRYAVGYADLRLLASTLLAVLALRDALVSGTAPTLCRVVLVVGTLALTKNEGLAIGAGVTAVLGYAVWRQRRWWWGGLALAASGGLLALWPALRVAFGLSTPYVDHAMALPLELLRSQVPAVLREWARLFVPLDASALWHWGALPWLTLLAVLHARRDKLVWALVAAWLAHLALYTYVLGAALPGDLVALLHTAAPRLMLHTAAWPIAILWRTVSCARPVTAAA